MPAMSFCRTTKITRNCQKGIQHSGEFRLNLMSLNQWWRKVLVFMFLRYSNDRRVKPRGCGRLTPVAWS